MGTKNNPAEHDCYDRALPDEPLFTLLARDPLAPRLLRLWAEMREYEISVGRRDKTDLVPIAEARKCALDMEAWRKENDGKWRTTQTEMFPSVSLCEDCPPATMTVPTRCLECPNNLHPHHAFNPQPQNSADVG